jgi:23S rRNA pseudouridine2605 synthase
MKNRPQKSTGFSLTPSEKPERIAKVIARTGICSRREAEVYIADGRVKVNGVLLESPAFTVTKSDIIEVDNVRLSAAEPPRLWRYHKPRGLVVSNKDEKGRDTIFTKLPESLPRVISIGRLDIDSEGLLLLTNDGELARHLELPATGWTRKYRVRVYGRVEEAKLEEIAEGVNIDGVQYGPVLARLDTQKNSNAWLTIAIKEGRNREVRNIMEYLGYPVTRLLRLSYGPFLLGKLEAGQVEEVKPSVLAQQLGLASDASDAKDAKQAAGAPKLRLKTKPAGQNLKSVKDSKSLKNTKSANRNKHKQQRPRRP